MTPQYILRASLCREPSCMDLRHYQGSVDQRRRMQLADIENLGWAEKYADTRTDQPKRGILFADWNHFAKEVVKILERMGYAIEWSDMVSTCDACGLLIETEPDSFGWRPEFVVTSSEILCVDCAWRDASISDRVELCQARGVSVFAARRDEIPDAVRG